MPHTILLAVTLADDEVEIGWNGDTGEVAESVRAALHEVIGDDGGAYVPAVRVLDPDIFPVPDDGPPFSGLLPQCEHVHPERGRCRLAAGHPSGPAYNFHPEVIDGHMYDAPPDADR